MEITVDTIENNLRFAGARIDPETGLHYNYHCYYDPATGRYLTTDPIGLEGGINPYVYVLNNPVNFVDPLGLDPKNLFPNQRYNSTNKIPKVTPTQPKYRPTIVPEITPKNYNPNSINNLPGKGIPESPNISRNMKSASGIFKAINNIMKIIKMGNPGSAPMIMINPELYQNPFEPLGPCKKWT